LLQLLQRKAFQHHTRLNAHAAEHRQGLEAYQQQYQDRTITYMHKIGFLSDQLTLVHMTQLNEEEIGYLAQAGTSIAHCPVANAKLADGICPVPQLQKAGINVALGSDASINNNTNHLLNEAYFAGLLHSVHNMQPELLPPRELFRMLTINGAKAMGLERETGTLEVGKKADIALFDLESDAFTPCYDPFSNLIYNAPDVRAHSVMVDGKWVLKNYNVVTVDAEEVRAQVNQRSKKIAEALKTIKN
jgi:cytosine/adenosine deaminase-related metal-dependent hydrolase